MAFGYIMLCAIVINTISSLGRTIIKSSIFNNPETIIWTIYGRNHLVQPNWHRRWLEFKLFHSVVWLLILSYSVGNTCQWNEIMSDYDELDDTIRLLLQSPGCITGTFEKFFNWMIKKSALRQNFKRLYIKLQALFTLVSIRNISKSAVI